MKTAVIICAYNEQNTIKDVIFSVSECKIFDEIIVVNDGSTDKTGNIIDKCKNSNNIIVIHLNQNMGKGFAMSIGVEKSSSEIIVFCDADLYGLKKQHFQDLILPVLNNEADMVLGQATETLINYDINPFKSFTGERAVIKANILPLLNDMKTSKFGVETLINLYFQANNKRIKFVKLSGLKHPTKFDKIHQFKATKEYISEAYQIIISIFNNFNLIKKIMNNKINNFFNMKWINLFSVLFMLLLTSGIIKSQDTIVSYQSIDAVDEDVKLKISGELLTDQRFLLKSPNDWAWNENRLTLKLEKKITNNSKFYSEVWLRNIGLPNITQSSDLYNKGIIDPYNLEIREAYVQLNGFLTSNLDLTIGRQRIVWGTADKLNPTDNLNPYDLEDILDFGRHRGSDAINLNYYLNNDFSLQAVFIPFFQPANMPVGVFANALNPDMELPQGMVLKDFSDTIIMPGYNLSKCTTTGFKFKGFAKGVDFSLSYMWGYDGLPFATRNTLIPVDAMGGTSINSQLSFARTHIIGADLATSVAGIGFWAEAAAFIPDQDVIMTNDLSAFYPGSPIPVTQDSLILDKTKPYIRFIVGGDYNFADGSYLNVQYLHGFINERGDGNLNDYFFLRYEKKFFNEKLKIVPIGGGFIVTDWDNVKNNYAIVYMPEIAYKATANAEISLSTVLFDGKGENLFAGLKDYDMFMFKLKYSF